MVQMTCMLDRKSTSPLDPVQLLRRVCVRLRVLTTHGQAHGMALADITAYHPLVSDVFTDVATELGLYLEIPELILASHGPVRHTRGFLDRLQ